jgi:hypothetical protein
MWLRISVFCYINTLILSGCKTDNCEKIQNDQVRIKDTINVVDIVSDLGKKITFNR